MFPEIEIGSRPSGLFRVQLLRVGVQDILGKTEILETKQRSSGAAGQRSSGKRVTSDSAMWQRCG